ncbi:pentapeptide repeat-containing protein [Streptomyces sp. NPDC001502]|uniref:pentapeptide repeat-containing protein n=1 Tax=Streptomyces sp. NPDC001502 TaxID=3364578 RepID=UPI0036A8E68F
MSAIAVAAFTWKSITQVSSEQDIAREGQITDRYNAAVGNLGNKGSEDVRLGGIYALQRIMQDSPRDQPTVINVLTSFIRGHSNEPKPKGGEALVSNDVFAAVKVLISRNSRNDGIGSPAFQGDAYFDRYLRNLRRIVDLQGADLHDLPLDRAQLSSANLSSANLSGAVLAAADLHDADLNNADLRDANLQEASLRNADLSYADLSDALLDSADFTCADLHSAHLKNRGTAGSITLDQVLSALNIDGATLPEHLAKDPKVQEMGWGNNPSCKQL